MRTLKSTILAIGLLLIAAPALAQNVNSYYSAAGNKLPQSSASPLPVSGRSLEVTATPAVTASSAYASGNAVGGLQTFAGVATTDSQGQVDNSSGILQAIGVNFKTAQTADLDVAVCTANPTGSTITDKAAVSIAAADFAKCRAYHLSGASCISLGTPTYCELANVSEPFVIPAGAALYAFLITRGTPTFGSTSDVSLSLRIVR